MANSAKSLLKMENGKKMNGDDFDFKGKQNSVLQDIRKEKSSLCKFSYSSSW